METRSWNDHGCRLTLTLSALSFPIHLISAIVLHRLPTDPFNLAFNFSLYCVWAAVLSALGLVGALKRSSTLVAIFSNHLLLDALLSTVPRLIILFAIASFADTLCTDFENQVDFSKAQCLAGVWGIQAVVGILVVAVTGVQWWCAVKVRRYARGLEAMREDEEVGFGVGHDDTEKRVGLAEEVDRGKKDVS